MNEAGSEAPADFKDVFLFNNMPIDYKNYPADWKTRIRPEILTRAQHKCEKCNIPNYAIVLRGVYCGIEAYQDENGEIFNAKNSDHIGSDYLGEVDQSGKNKLVKIVLTIAHLDHNVKNNDYSNLKALCQRCHNRHDVSFRKANRRKNKGITDIFSETN